MKEQRFQEILAELERCDFRETLQLTRDCFRKEHKEQELLCCFEVHLRFNWGRREENFMLEAEKVVPTLKSLSEESIFCLASIGIDPVVVYADDSGKEQKYGVPSTTVLTGCGETRASSYFLGDIQPHWKELRLRLDGGVEQVHHRDTLGFGSVVAQTPSGPLKVLVMDDNTLTLIRGTNAAELAENREYLRECLPGVEAALFYDHEEFPALWEWLHIDEEWEDRDSYYQHHSNRDKLWEGMEFINNLYYDKGLPDVTILSLQPRSVTLSLQDGRKPPVQVVLDQPNNPVVIWKKGKHSLKAKIYVPEPNGRKSWTYQQTEPVPTGCRVMLDLRLEGTESVGYSGTVDVRSAPCRLELKNYSGDFREWPYVWGFDHGRMILGHGCPQYDSRVTFKGFFAPGQTYVFNIDKYGRLSDEAPRQGQLTLYWENVQMGFEVEDGVLKSVPDQEEIIVPAEVREMHYQALLTASSLRKIIIHQDVTKFSSALYEYHREQLRKLEVVYEGSLQQWFDNAWKLAGHLKRLVIQGKEYDFYDTPDLVIPEGVTRIGEGCFSYSEVLRTLVLPPEVVDIGEHAFAYCDHLQSVKVQGPAVVGRDAFVSCHELSEIELADGVVALETGCFDYLTKVQSIFIPLSVKKVGIEISSQNDGGCVRPAFRCAAPSRPNGWSKHWNLAYYDPRFGMGHGYDYYHPTQWNCKRE